MNYDCAGRISQKQIDCTPQIQQPQNSNDSIHLQQTQTIHQAQIPRLNVPNFSGLYEDWISFRDLFNAAVHSNNQIQPVHKLQYLKSLLKGEAEILLRQTPITAENYAIAWASLKDRFENKRVLIHNNLRKLFNQRRAEESASSIRKLLDTPRECTNSLKIHGIDIMSWDCILVYLVSQFIPAESNTLWEQSIIKNVLPTFNKLMDFLETRFRILEFTPSQSQLNSQLRTRSRPQIII